MEGGAHTRACVPHISSSQTAATQWQRATGLVLLVPSSTQGRVLLSFQQRQILGLIMFSSSHWFWEVQNQKGAQVLSVWDTGASPQPVRFTPASFTPPPHLFSPLNPVAPCVCFSATWSLWGRRHHHISKASMERGEPSGMAGRPGSAVGGLGSPGPAPKPLSGGASLPLPGPLLPGMSPHHSLPPQGMC